MHQTHQELITRQGNKPETTLNEKKQYQASCESTKMGQVQSLKL